MIDSKKDFNDNNKDVIGRRSGRLVILNNIEPSLYKKNKYGKWLCSCDCGTTKVLDGMAFLRKDRSMSCGCLQKESQKVMAANRRRPGVVTINAQYLMHRSKGNWKGLGYLNKEDWLTIALQPCYYCGEIDTRNSFCGRTEKYQKKHKVSYTEEQVKEYDAKVNGVDRIDSTKGYEIDNCRPCCTQCNTLKMDYTEEEFFNKISVIHNKHSYSNVSLGALLCN